MRGRRLVYVAIACGLLVWALYTPAPPRPLFPIREPVPPTELGSAFDPTHCGTVSGAVNWSGAIPVVKPIELLQVQNPPGANPVTPNPNAPRIRDGRLEGAVVYLSRVDLRRSAPWNLLPVSIEVQQMGVIVKQGERDGRIAIVRRGAAVSLASREPALHSIRGRGAAFFTQMLPVPGRPVNRILLDEGVVELSSGSGYYWLRGYLFVTDHPYAAVTAPNGQFQFEAVPDGEYEAMCWVPNWHIDRLENDPEGIGGPVRLYFRPAVEKRQHIVVKADVAADLKFNLSAADFEP
jgi:hypothetical protein